MLRGECLAHIESEERRLEQWDFLHCASGTHHGFVGAGDGPCVLLMVGSRVGGRTFDYPDQGAASRRRPMWATRTGGLALDRPSSAEAECGLGRQPISRVQSGENAFVSRPDSITSRAASSCLYRTTVANRRSRRGTREPEADGSVEVTHWDQWRGRSLRRDVRSGGESRRSRDRHGGVHGPCAKSSDPPDGPEGRVRGAWQLNRRAGVDAPSGALHGASRPGSVAGEVEAPAARAKPSCVRRHEPDFETRLLRGSSSASATRHACGPPQCADGESASALRPARALLRPSSSWATSSPTRPRSGGGR